MKKFVVFVIIIGVFALSALTASAEDALRLVDGANLLTDVEEEKLLSILNETSERLEYDVVIITVNSIGRSDPEYYAENMFYDNGYGVDGEGALFLISMENRDWAIYSTDMSNSTVRAVGNSASNHLAVGDYYGAFTAFAAGIEEEKVSETAFPLLRNIIIALAVGLVVAFIVVTVMKGKLKTVRACDNAKNYVRDGSFNLQHSRDLYLYSTVTRVPRPKNNSGGGRAGGGGGRASGKF